MWALVGGLGCADLVNCVCCACRTPCVRASRHTTMPLWWVVGGGGGHSCDAGMCVRACAYTPTIRHARSCPAAPVHACMQGWKRAMCGLSFMPPIQVLLTKSMMREDTQI